MATVSELTSKNIASAQANVQTWGNVIINVNVYGATGDGSDESQKIQDAINYASSLSLNGSMAVVKFAHSKTYMVGNLQLKSNVILDLNGCTLKLLPNAHTYSINGGIADANGNYPSNVIGTTLLHTGGDWYDAGVRAKDENNSEYIIENCIIKNGTIDGNKLNNTLGDVGFNASAMAEGIAIYQAKNVQVLNCKIVDCGMDGIGIGYTLHGGSDYCKILNCYFEGNVRCGIAQMTGKYNEIARCVVKHTGTGFGIVLEANFDDEVNYRHNIHDNYIENSFGNVSVKVSKQFDITFNNNIIKGSVNIHPANKTGGSKYANNTLIGSGGNAFNLSGSEFTTTDFKMFSIVNNNIFGYDYIVGNIASGGHGHFYFSNNIVNSKYGFDLSRPFNIKIDNNVIKLSGGDNAISGFSIRFGFVDLIPNQGDILIKNNKISGGDVGSILTIIKESTPPTITRKFVVLENNEINVVANGLNSFVINGEITFKGNKILGLTTPINFSSNTIDSHFINNDIEANTTIDLTLFSATCKNVTFENNILRNLNIVLGRPHNCIVNDNTIIEGKIKVVYSFTSGGIGNNHFVNNRCFATSAIDYAMHLITGSGYLVSDFTADDIFENNYHLGTFTNRSFFASGTPKKLGYNTWNKLILWRDAIPTTGSWAVGDIVYNTVPTTGGYIGWVCITAGTPGTFKGFGSINLQGSITWDPASLADGAGETSLAITVTGSALGDFVMVSAPYDLQGITCNGYVSAADTVKIRIQNETGGIIDLASGTWRVKTIKQ